jgi:phosphatidylethanolamine/phosphatidyl-N-methylethanolamine N-methyltransferase
MPSDLPLFFRELILRPKQISALAPSSRVLARAMARPLTPGGGRVAEFGPGTGSLTRAILKRGIAPADLTLFEMNPTFAENLRRTFAGVTVHTAPAQAMPDLVPPGLAAVVSGLPLLSMPPAVQQGIYGAAFQVLRPGGFVVQFTYGGREPLAEPVRDALGLLAAPGPRIWANLPPARIWIYARAADGMRRYAD